MSRRRTRVDMHHRMPTFTASGVRLPGLAPKLLLSLALHGALLYWVLQAMPGLTLPPPAAPLPIQVALVPPRPVATRPAARALPVAAAAPMAQAARAVPRSAPKPAPAALPNGAGATSSTVAAPASAPAAAEPNAAATAAVAAAASAANAAPPALEPARFDADYLNNPAPAYPLLSRRQGETGRVLL